MTDRYKYNKEIAIFMGAIITITGSHTLTATFNTFENVAIRNLRYCDNWNKLIPVIKVIKEVNKFETPTHKILYQDVCNAIDALDKKESFKSVGKYATYINHLFK